VVHCFQAGPYHSCLAEATGVLAGLCLNHARASPARAPPVRLPMAAAVAAGPAQSASHVLHLWSTSLPTGAATVGSYPSPYGRVKKRLAAPIERAFVGTGVRRGGIVRGVAGSGGMLAAVLAVPQGPCWTSVPDVVGKLVWCQTLRAA
jgi:hypothetical protein